MEEKKNVRWEDGKSAALDNAFDCFLMACFAFVITCGVCLGTFAANYMSAGLELEVSLIMVGSGGLVVSAWFAKQSYRSWRRYCTWNDRLETRKNLAIGGLTRPEDSPKLEHSSFIRRKP